MNVQELKDVPFVYENNIGEALLVRANQLVTFKLGPPDLCHVVMVDTKTNKLFSAFHHVTGVEASSPGSLSAYVSYLKYFVEQDKQAVRIKGAMYCCYHSFAHMDVRVDIRFPLNVRIEGVLKNGKNANVPSVEENPLFWANLHTCAALRALTDTEYPPRVPYLLRLPPFPDLESESRFLNALVLSFESGPQLGCEPFIQVPSLTFNLLIHTLVDSFGSSLGRWDLLAQTWSKLVAIDNGVYGLLADAQMKQNLDARAAKSLHTGLLVQPNNSTLLRAQVDFLLKRGDAEGALYIAKRLVRVSPLEFMSWDALIRCYSVTSDWSSALLALNACPITSVCSRDIPKLPVISGENVPGEEQRTVYQELYDQEMVPLESVRSNFKKHYEILGRLVSAAEWENLLTHRSEVFLMEDDVVSNKKRVCEYWLSYLFESIYQELAHFTYMQEDLPQATRTSSNAEQMGDTACRIMQTVEAVKYYAESVQLRYSPHVLYKLINVASELGAIPQALSAISHLYSFPGQIEHLFRVCGVVCFPDLVGSALYKLIRRYGLQTIRSEAIKINTPPLVFDKLNKFFDYAKKFNFPGVNL